MKEVGGLNWKFGVVTNLFHSLIHSFIRVNTEACIHANFAAIWDTSILNVHYEYF